VTAPQRSMTPGNGHPTAEHVVLGAGAAAQSLVRALRADGSPSIRVVSRSGKWVGGPDVQVVAAELQDPAVATSLTAGARVIYQVLNPAYHRWAQEFPGLQRSAIAAAEAAGARLVVLDNVYAYGTPIQGAPFTEDSPINPVSRKGEVRAAMHRQLMAAHDAGRVEVAVGRASDYFGPGGGAQSALGDQVLRAARTGGKARVLGDPDQPHTYTFLPDIGAGLKLLGTHPNAAGRVWHLPNDPQTRTTRQLIDTLYRLAGQGPARLTRTPSWLLRIVGLRQPAAGELVEMLYEFTQPFVVDSSLIATELGLRATPIDTALAATLDSFRE
jgi:nucleoside-diphosphate-sugar epimerase